MKGFVYNGKSTEDILSVPLILATFDSIDSIQGVSKTDNIGNQTITRETPNEYGTISALPSFQYGLIKSDGSAFSDDEQRIVEKWLTSPRFSKELKIIDYNPHALSAIDDISFYYNNSENMNEMKDCFNTIINFEYDAQGNLISETDSNGVTVIYNYKDGLLTSTVEENQITQYMYNSDYQVDKIIKPNNVIYSYSYVNNLLSSITGSDGTCVKYYYDTMGFLVSEEDNNGNKITYNYKDGYLASSKDKRGITTYTYDSDHNLADINYPDGSTATYFYENQKLVRAIEPDLYHLKRNTSGNQVFYYYGRFTETNWYIYSGGYAGLMFTFTCSTAYSYRKYFNTFILDGNEDIELNCVTDNADDYIYPTLSFSSTLDNDREIHFSIESVTDNSNKMNAIMKTGKNITMDCEHCIIWNYQDKNDITSREEYTYSDIGWDDLDNIYWCRLIEGINKWKVIGKGILTIEYKSPFKKVGGWL